MSNPADLPLSNAPQEQAAPLSGVVAFAIAGGFSLLLWLAVLFQTVFIVPFFAKTFLDFKMKLPLVTEFVLRDMWWFSLACLVPSIGFAVVMRPRWIGLSVLVLTPLAINLLIMLGVYFPYAELLEGLAGGPKK